MSSIPLGQGGWVYAMTSAAIYDDGKGLIKIGCTTLDPHERARQLTAATASPTAFYVLYSRRAEDANAAESHVHEILDEFRVNEKREYFRIPPAVAIHAIDRACGGANVSLPDLSFSELFALFPDNGSARELTEYERTLCRALEEKTRGKVFAP